MDKLVWEITTQLALFVLLIVAAVTDLSYRKVYDWLTVPAMAIGLSLAFMVGGLPLLWRHFALGLFPAVLIFGFFVYSRQMGGGDLKLMAAVGAIKGPFVFQALFWTSLFGAILGLGTLIWHGRFVSGLARALGLAVRLDTPRLDASSLDASSLDASSLDASRAASSVSGGLVAENFSSTVQTVGTAIDTNESPVLEGAALAKAAAPSDSSSTHVSSQGAPDVAAAGPKNADDALALRVPYGVAIAFGSFFAWFLEEFGRPL